MYFVGFSMGSIKYLVYYHIAKTVLPIPQIKHFFLLKCDLHTTETIGKFPSKMINIYT